MIKRKSIIILIIISILLIVLVFIKTNIVDKNDIVLPENYSLENYRIEKITDISCQKSIECTTPPEYLIRSNCPYTSLCIKKKCNVICPIYKQ